jgi:hypothetical protein
LRAGGINDCAKCSKHGIGAVVFDIVPGAVDDAVFAAR